MQTRFLRMGIGLFFAGMLATANVLAQAQQPGTDLSIYSPKQHPLYDGRFIMSATRIYMVGSLNDPPGWNHLDNQAEHVTPVEGTAEIDVNEADNTGTFVARLKIPEGDLVLEFGRFHSANPCQDGGVAAFIFEHGDSGCGDTNWPKSLLYVAGWGTGHATLNGMPLFNDYEMHFMVMQGVRDRQTLKANYPIADKKGFAGEVNPAMMHLDFFIRSAETDNRNNPPRRHFLHFFAMEVTWK